MLAAVVFKWHLLYFQAIRRRPTPPLAFGFSSKYPVACLNPMKNNPNGKKIGLPPIHPGEFLREDILPETGLSVSAAARALGVSRQMLHEILAERKPLSAVMCLKISRPFGSSPEMWMRLQASYDLKKAARDKRVMERGR